MKYNIKFSTLVFLSILVSFLLLPLNGTAQSPCEPPDTPTLIAPSHNIWIWYDPVFQAQVTDPDGEGVRACFNISGHVSGCGNWVNSGEISEWGVNLGICTQYDWQAYAENACNTTSLLWSSYWRIGVDKNPPTSSIDYPTGIINYTTFTVNLIESEDCSGIRRGAVYYRYGLSPDILGRWWFYSSDTNDFNFTGQDGYSYQFRYRVQDLAGNWSDFAEGEIITIRITNPPDIPILQAPPNTWINYNPTFQALVSDLDNDDVRAYFSITDNGADWGNWINSGGISEWGPIDLGTCTIHDGEDGYQWRAYAEDSRNLTSDWSSDWRVRVDKDPPSSSIDYPTGIINYTTFTVSLTESDGCSGINNGNVEISIDEGNWQNYSSSINDFDYTGENGRCYRFHYQVQDNAGNWSGWSERAQVCIQLPVPTVTLTANPSTIDQGQSSTLTWASTDAANCTASDGWSGSKPISGTQAISPDTTTTYTLTCTGDGGSASDSVTVTVTIPPPPPVPTVTLTANPSTIDQGQSSTLTWASTDAANCTASDGWSGSKPISGSEIVSPSSNALYVLTCTGPGGSASDSVTITVIIPPPPPDCECSSGPCCDSDGCNFKSSSASCDSGYDYQCLGTGCGDDSQRQRWTQYCSGSSTNCDGSIERDEWETIPCEDKELCYTTSPYCRYDSSCGPPPPPPPGLVPCGRPGLPSCKLCHFLVLAKNIVNFGLKLVSSLTILAIVIGGILILTARGSVNQATIGKKLIYFAIMGAVIALASWTIVNLIVGFLANPDIFLFPWDEIDCP